MNYYGLQDANTLQEVPNALAICSAKELAVAHFSIQLGVELTLEDTMGPPVYFMSENRTPEQATWIRFDIAVYAAEGR